MDVDIKSRPGFPDLQLFDRQDTGRGERRIGYRGQNRRLRRAIHEIANGRSHQQSAVHQDHTGGNQSGPVVGRFPSGAADQGHRDSDKGGARTDGVSAVMPCVGGNDDATGRLAHRHHPVGKKFLDDDHQGQHQQGPPGGRAVGGAYFRDRFDGNAGSGAQHEGRHPSRRQCFGASVAEGIALVGVPTRYPETAPNHE